MSKNVRTSTRLSRGERVPPPWIAARKAQRPAWLCLTDADERLFKEFVFAELDRRYSAETEAMAAELNSATAAAPDVEEWEAPAAVKRSRGRPPVDPVERQFLPTEDAARTVVTVREIFEDYWDRWSHKRPSAEEIAAEYVSWFGQPVTAEQVLIRKARETKRRPR